MFKSRSQELIRGLVAHGHGFAIQNAIPATTVAYDGNRIAVLALEETLLPTRIMTLRLKHYASRPAVQAFQTYVHEAFSPRRHLRARINNPAGGRSGEAAEVLTARGGCFLPLRVRRLPAQ